MKKIKQEKIAKKPKEINSDKFAPILFLVLALIYFYDFLSGKKMIYGTDWILGSIPSWKFMAEHINQFKDFAFWHPHIFGGLPTIAAFFGDLISPATLFRLFLSPDVVHTWTFILFLFLAGIGTYFYLKEIGVNKIVATVCGVIYMFAGNLVTTTYGGHAGRTGGAAIFPLILFFLHRGIERKRFFYFLLMGGILGFGFLGAHFQLTYYAVIASGIYFLIQIIGKWRENRLPGSAKIILYYLSGIVLMFALIAIQYLPVYFNLPYAARGAERGYAFASSWALPPLETFDLIVPNFSGILDNYWGENWFKLHSEYLGILPILALFLGLLLKFRFRYAKFFLFLGILGLLFSYGGHTPLYRIPYHLLPGVSKFRAPSQIFYLVAFSIVVITGLAISEIMKQSATRGQADNSDVRRKIKKFLLIFIGILGLGLILSYLLKGTILQTLKDFLESTLRGQYPETQVQEKIKNLYDNYPLFQQALIKTLVLAGIFSFLIYLVAIGKLKPLTWLAIILPLLIFDQWSVTKKFLRSTVPGQEYYAPDEVVNFLKAQEKDGFNYRVYPLVYERSQDGILMFYNIQSVAGYHPNPLQTYQDFIGAEKTVMFSPTNLIYQNFLNLLNVKYIISVTLPEDISRYDRATQERIRELKLFFSRPDFELVFQGRKNVVYKNRSVLPRAFLVPNYEVITNKDEVIARLKDPNFKPEQTAIISESATIIPFSKGDSLIGDATIKSYDANRIIIECSLSRPGLLVLSENYHPDWKVAIDDQPQKVYRAYHTFRAVWLDSGNHTVTFYYASKYYHLGKTISLVGLLFLLVTLIFARARRPK